MAEITGGLQPLGEVIPEQFQNTPTIQQAMMQETATQEQVTTPSSAEIITRIEDKITRENMSYDEAKAFRAQNQGLVLNAVDFGGLDFQTQGQIMKKWDTKLPMSVQAHYETLDPEDPENRKSLELYNDYQAIRNGEETQTTGWDAFGNRFLETSVAGGLGVGAFNLINPQGEDIRETLYGDDVKFMEAAMLSTGEKFDNDIVSDYKAGKVMGTVAGIAADIASTLAFGAVTGVAGTATSAGLKVAQATSKFGTMGKIVGQVARYGIPAATAGLEFTAETAVMDWVQQDLDSREGLEEFASKVPGTFLKGAAFGVVGEGLGLIFQNKVGQRALTNLDEFNGKATSPHGSLVNDLQEASDKYVAYATRPSTPELDAEYLSDLLSDGFSEKQALYLVNTNRQANLFSTPGVLKNDQILQDTLMETQYGAKLTREGDDVIFSSFNNIDLEAPVRIRSEVEFYNFMKEQIPASYNKISDDLFGRVGKGAPTPTITAKSVTKAEGKPVSLSANRIHKAFGASDQITDQRTLQEMTDQLFPQRKVTVEIMDGGSVINRVGDVDDLKILIPGSINTPAKSRSAMMSFFEQVTEQGKRVGRDIGFDTKELQAFFRGQNKFKYDLDLLAKMGRTADIQEVDGAFIAALRKADGSETPLLTRGQLTQYATKADAESAVAKIAHIEAMGGVTGVIEDVTTRGYKVTAKADGLWNITARGGEDMGTMTMNEMFDNTLLQPRLPYSLIPDEINVRYFGEVTSESIETKGMSIMEASTELSKYKTRPSGYIEADPNGGFRIFAGSDGIQIENPTTGFTRNFETGKQAKQYLEEVDSRWNNLYNRSAEQGYTLTFTRGGYALSNGNESHVFLNSDTVESFLGRDSAIRVRDILSPELQDVTSRLTREARMELDKVYKSKVADNIAYRTAEGVDIESPTFFEKHYVDITNVVNKAKNPHADRIDKAIGAVRRRTGNAIAIDHKFVKSLENNFSDLEGAWMYNILSFDGANSSEWAKISETVNKNMGTNIQFSQKHMEAMDDIRKFFDHKSSAFNVPPWKFIANYAPAFNSKKPIAQGEWNDVNSIKRLLRDHLDIPNGQEPFFMNLRVDEVSELASNNIFDVMKTYSSAGNRYIYMGKLRDEFEELVKSGAISDDLGSTIALKFRDAFSKSDPRDITSQIKRINKRRAKAKGIEDGIGKYKKWADNPAKKETEIRKALLAEDPATMLSTAMASSLMGLNLRLPIRNLFQIQTHTMPVVGAKFTEMSMLEMNFNVAKRRALKADLLRSGIISDIMPQQTVTAGGKLKRATQLGTSWFKASDNMNRMITANASEMRFDASIKSFMEHKQGTKLIDELRLSFLSEGDQQAIIGHIGKNEFSTAKKIYRDRIVNMTQLNYDPSNAPEAWRGFWGKAYGSYGTFPTQTLQLWKKGVTQPSKLRVAGFVGAATAGAMATGIIMNDILDLGGVPYDPLSSIMFTGGPIISAAPTIQRSIGAALDPGSDATFLQRASKVVGAPASFLPFGMSVKRGGEVIGNFQDGEYYEGVIRMMGGRADADRRGVAGTFLDAGDVDFDINSVDMIDGIIDMMQ